MPKGAEGSRMVSVPYVCSSLAFLISLQAGESAPHKVQDSQVRESPTTERSESVDDSYISEHATNNVEDSATTV